MVRPVQSTSSRMFLWMIIVALAALPLAAQTPSACPDPEQLLKNFGIEKGKAGYQPLEPNLRLLYPLNGMGEGALEIRYLVRGQLHLSELLDLSKAELPAPKSVAKGDEKSKAAERPAFGGILKNGFDDLRLRGLGQNGEPPRQLRGKFLDKPRVVELLALHPEHVRELHRLYAEGAGIDVEVHRSGQRIEALVFDELLRRSGELREKVLVPVVVASELRGPGISRRVALPITTNDYLPDCGDCTSTTPCSTECGYDPGKGGPVTCGEYGVCQAECTAQMNWGEYYTDWYFYGSGPSGWGECFVTEYYNRWHDEYVYVWRRDRIRQTNNCPNAPSCDGCYITEQVVGYQLTYDSCYARTAYYCSPAYMPCCGALCTWFPGIPCSDDWPC